MWPGYETTSFAFGRKINPWFFFCNSGKWLALLVIERVAIVFRGSSNLPDLSSFMKCSILVPKCTIECSRKRLPFKSLLHHILNGHCTLMPFAFINSWLSVHFRIGLRLGTPNESAKTSDETCDFICLVWVFVHNVFHRLFDENVLHKTKDKITER